MESETRPLPNLNGRQRFLAAIRREPVARPPFWVMRQAGRYLPEYRQTREGRTFLDMVHDPAIATEITLQPIRRFAMDAAVIFSDILVPPAAMGMGLRFEEGQGPIFDHPIRDRADVDALRPFDPEEKTPFVYEALRRVRQELGEDRALIGFCGAPFTTAAYMVEGRGSRDFAHTKGWMYRDPAGFAELLDTVVDALIPYLGFQGEVGADALMLFDSWGGALDAETYRRVLFPSMERLVCSVKAVGRPVILYVNGGGHLLETLADLGPDVIGMDWRIDPAEARRRVGDRVALQGNLDPTALFGPPEVVAEEVARTLRRFGSAPGHIFNLGSGILPPTPVVSMETLAHTIQNWVWS